jgi:hypothetical protein
MGGRKMPIWYPIPLPDTTVKARKIPILPVEQGKLSPSSKEWQGQTHTDAVQTTN